MHGSLQSNLQARPRLSSDSCSPQQPQPYRNAIMQRNGRDGLVRLLGVSKLGVSKYQEKDPREKGTKGGLAADGQSAV